MLMPIACHFVHDSEARECPIDAASIAPGQPPVTIS